MKRILLVNGDPNSINSELIYKVYKRLHNRIKKKIYVVSNSNLLKSQFKKLNYNLEIQNIDNINKKNNSLCLKVINIPLNFTDPFKVSKKNASIFLIKCLNTAHDLANDKSAIGIINCPIDKELLRNTKKRGVTEFLASKCKVKNSEVMMIYNEKFSVVPLTTHISLKEVSKSITTKLIENKINTINKCYKKIFGKQPKIGVLGLDPHNSEYSKKSEEVQKIIPSISKLKKKGISVFGPIVPDTAFIKKFKKFNVVVGMYHDQVLTPFKLIFHFNAINITLGLNYIRVSPDHGPGKDLIGKNKGNFLSLFKCVKFFEKI